MRRVALGLAVVVLASVACGSDDQSLAEMQLRAKAGIVQVLRDGELIRVQDTFTLRPGDLVVTKRDALASFALEGGDEHRQVDVAPSSEVAVTSTTAVEARSGSALIEADQPTAVQFNQVRIKTSGATFRVDRGFGATRAGVYAGTIELGAPGEDELRVDAFFETSVVAGDIPRSPVPYQLDLQDDWDATLLARVVDMELALKELGRGLTNQLGVDRPNLAYFGRLAGDDPVGFMKPFVRDRGPADLLIAFTIARNSGGDLGRAFERAFGYYDQGATWGIVAAIMDVAPRPVVAQLGRLILGTQVVAEGRGENAEFSVAAAAASQPGSGSVSGGAPDGGSNPDGSEPPGAGDGGDDPPDDDQKPQDPPEECSDSVECNVEDLQDQLEPDPEPSPSPTGIDLLGGLP